MPTITIDGKEIPAREGQSIIEAALEHGIEIPHFCWHPALSAPANCRICLVKVGFPKKNPDGSIATDEQGNPIIQYMPKLQPSCRFPVSDGMHVQFQVSEVIEAQHAVMEFLLINHPLDCPICDEAGECKLQEYAYFYSKGKSRFVEEKNHKPKHVVWGPNVIFDAERCISCSRCIRFAEEIAHDPSIQFVERNDHVTIELFPGTEFRNPYSMNVIELCPVGALTSADFRFKARVWEMSFTPSICPGCARGCNMYVGVMQNQILRLQPRTNLYVNQYWMCDHGRLTQYPFVNQNRIDKPRVRTHNSRFEEVKWEEALPVFHDFLTQYPAHQIAILVSGRLSNEEAFALQKFHTDILPQSSLFFLSIEDPEFEDSFLRVRDVRPNTNGVKAIFGEKLQDITTEKLRELTEENSIAMLIIIGEDLISVFGDEGRAIVQSSEKLVFITSNATETAKMADLILSLATYAEMEGTFTNTDNRVQHFLPALVTADRPYRWNMKASRWDKMGAWNDRWSHGPIRHCRPLWRILQDTAALFGHQWNYRKAEDLFTELSHTHPLFAGMTYALLDKYHGLYLGKADQPDPEVYHYDSHRLKPERDDFRYYQLYANVEKWT